MKTAADFRRAELRRKLRRAEERERFWYAERGRRFRAMSKSCLKPWSRALAAQQKWSDIARILRRTLREDGARRKRAI